jgi:hypothetical protein
MLNAWRFQCKDKLQISFNPKDGVRRKLVSVHAIVPLLISGHLSFISPADWNLSPSKIILIFWEQVIITGARGNVVVKALCYKSEGRGFDTRLGDF